MYCNDDDENVASNLLNHYLKLIVPDPNDYILSSGLNITELMLREGEDAVLDLTKENHNKLISEHEWQEVRDKFQPMQAITIPANFKMAVEFLSLDVVSVLFPLYFTVIEFKVNENISFCRKIAKN